MRFRVLGPLEFYRDGRWHGIGSAKQRALLATLIAQSNHIVPVEALVEELWPQRPPASVSTLIAGYVWRLRRAIGDRDGQVIVTRAPGYRLAADPTDIDVERFDATLADAHAQLKAGQIEDCVAGFGAALRLWRGSPYADVPASPLIVSAAARLEESRLTAFEACVGAEFDLGRQPAVVPELRHMVTQHPLRERLHAHLMRALYQQGQHAMALVAYRDVRRLLIDELGTEPSSELQHLHRRILHKDPTLSPVVR